MPVTDEPHSAREKEKDRRDRWRDREEEMGKGKVGMLGRAEDMSIAICLKLGMYFYSCCHAQGDGRGTGGIMWSVATPEC